MKKRSIESFYRTGGGLLGVVAVFAILVAVNVIVGRLRCRVDLTEENLYTLSKGSRGILGDLDRDVVLKFFCNRSAPQVPVHLKNFAKEVEDLLEEYRIAGGGKIVLEMHDPEPDSDAEEWAQKYGVAGQNIGVLDFTYYMGLVAVSGDSEAALPVVDPRQEGLLEYNITRLIYRVVNPQKPVVGVLSSLPVFGSRRPPFAMPGQPPPQPQPPWMVVEELRKDFDVREVEPGAESIDADIQALVLIHPKDLSDATMYAVDQFLMRGGRLLAFLDPNCTVDVNPAAGNNPMQAMINKTPSNLEPLLSAWGVRYDPVKVLADYGLASPIRAANNRIEESPVVLTIVEDRINREDVATSQLGTMVMAFAAVFGDETGKDLTFEPLVSSTADSGLVGAVTATFGGQAVRSEYKRGGVEKHLAVRLTGTFESAFPDGAPDAKDAEDDGDAGDDGPAGVTEAEHLKQGESAVVLVGDVDMLVDRFCVEEMNFFGFTAHRPLNDNLNFLGNLAEQLAGSSALIGIRSRGRFSRPFEKVLELQRRALATWQEREALLERKLSDTQQKLREMQAGKDQSQRFILSEEQRRAVEQFRKDELRIKRELKDVRKNLRADIERLGVWVKSVNIVLMPLLVSLAGVGFGLYRKRTA